MWADFRSEIQPRANGARHFGFIDDGASPIDQMRQDLFSVSYALT
jgi:hypothetical protein